MAWCEANRVDFVFGLARNERLEEADQGRTLDDRDAGQHSDRPVGAALLQGFHLVDAGQLEPASRRVVGKAEVTRGDANPRFVVTSLTSKRGGCPVSLRDGLLRTR